MNDLIRLNIVKEEQGGFLGDNVNHEKLLSFEVAKVEGYLAGITPNTTRSPDWSICQKCDKPSIKVQLIERVSKYGTVYKYKLFRHLDHRKHNRYVYHYVREPLSVHTS